jgi:HYDIN/CFA65/VesB-like, Ig-like domain
MRPQASHSVSLTLLFVALCAGAAFAQRSDVPDQKKSQAVGKVAVDPKALKFGKVTQAATLQLNLENSGSAPISGTITANAATPFTIISGNSSFGPLNPGETYSIIVQFAPTKKGSYASDFTIVSNAKNSKLKVAVSGSAKELATPTPSPSPAPTPSVTPAPTPSPSSTPSPIATPSLALAGSVNGPDPIGGAQVTAWMVGDTGYGQGASPLACVTTDANGNFAFGASPGCGGSLPNGFLCPSAARQIYLIADGGTAAAQTAANPQIALVAMAGQCSAITGASAITINELTTITTVYALAQFISAANPYEIGAPPTNAVGFGNALATLANLVDATSGTSPGANLPAGATLPLTKINSLAAALASCVNSTGTLNDEPSSCGELMCDALPGAIYNTTSGACAAPAATTPPSDTLGAAIAIATNPGAVKVADICSLAGLEASAFAPVVECNSAASPPSPTDWTLAINFTGSGLDEPRAIALDASGDVWIANEASQEGSGSLTEFAPNGAALSPADGFADSGFDVPSALAIDPSGNVWVVNAIGSSLSELTSRGVPFSPNAYVGGGLDNPIAIAFDSSGNAWVANNVSAGNVSEFSPEGQPLSPAAGYTGNGLISSRGLVIGATDGVWVLNTPYSGNSANLSDLTLLNSSGTVESPSDGYSGGGIFASAGLALDGKGNIWISNEFGGSNTAGSLSEFNSSGTALSPATGYAGGGLYAPTGIAIDGNNDIWTVNNVGNSLSEFSPTGSSISPITGYAGGLNGPLGLAIDSAGNLWVANYNGDSITEFIGAAAPVVTPLLGLPRKP